MNVFTFRKANRFTAKPFDTCSQGQMISLDFFVYSFCLKPACQAEASPDKRNCCQRKPFLSEMAQAGKEVRLNTYGTSEKQRKRYGNRR